jgi:glyoxylase-like metal-dependent hydrolase (beta-lactamase superfamily II)
VSVTGSAASPLVRHATVGAFQENCYLVADVDAGRGVLVDPGAEGGRLLRMVQDAGVALEAIWLTHAHLDHVGGIAEIRRSLDVPIFLHPADATVYAFADRAAAAYGLPFEQPPAFDRQLADGDELSVGRFRFRVIHFPGHSPGQCAFVGEGVAMVGDHIFQGSIGRTDLPLSDPAAMQRSLERAARDLAPSLTLYPGHGPATTMARELRTNPFLTGVARVVGASA